jgi:hypothetical protein
MNMNKLLHQSIASMIASEDDIQNSYELLPITPNIEEGIKVSLPHVRLSLQHFN